ncbi:MAG TPA: efflux RND transporter periplasmic adaptor subunit [Desulfomonilaceae bacterium]|nr:efflux RND transporter periplasmic adaptor subunit [Desulfomonilaceae bacterium]
MITGRVSLLAIIWVGLIALAPTGSLCAQNAAAEGKPADRNPESPKIVQVETLRTQGDVTVSGSVVARQTAVLSARVSGYITDLKVDAGDHVSNGQELVRIDTKELSEREKEARAALDSANADLSNAEKDLHRYTPLYESRAVSKQQFDEIQKKYDVAQAARQKARAALDQAGTQLSYGDIRAPFDGIIADKMVNVGDLAMPGRPLLTVYMPGTLELVAPVGEQYAKFIKEGTQVSIAIPSLGFRQSASIREVVPQTSEQTKTITVKAPIPDTRGLNPGVYGTLTFHTVSSEVIAVPLQAVRIVGQLQTVRVVRDNRIETRYVRTGRKLNDEKIEILSGLDPDEKILVD